MAYEKEKEQPKPVLPKDQGKAKGLNKEVKLKQKRFDRIHNKLYVMLLMKKLKRIVM